MWGRVLHCWDLPSIWVEDLEASEQWFSECSPQILFNHSVVSDSVTLWAVGLCVSLATAAPCANISYMLGTVLSSHMDLLIECAPIV